MTGFFLFLSCATQGGKFCRIKRGKPEVAGSCRDAESKTPAKVKSRRVGVAGQHALTRLIEAKHALTRLPLFTAMGGKTAAPWSESLLPDFRAALSFQTGLSKYVDRPGRLPYIGCPFYEYFGL
jgi:hypothetical protein